jgi:hypothetical protein
VRSLDAFRRKRAHYYAFFGKLTRSHLFAQKVGDRTKKRRENQAFKGRPGFGRYGANVAAGTRAASLCSFSCQLRLKNCTAFSCFFAAARDLNVPRFRRFPVFGFFLREYKR